MTKTAYAVIGANFGDEGKGLTTDYLCSLAKGEPVTVVRFNGGAQAGHTVQLPNGARHVFNHQGSGSFLDADTYLSRHFVCNPIVFAHERARFIGNGVTPRYRIIADPECIISTPWDMMINQIAETRRGHLRHGSCGVGINETIERNTDHGQYSLTLEEALSEDFARSVCCLIQREYVWTRLAKLGVNDYDLTAEELQNLMSAEIREKYLSDLQDFLKVVGLTSPQYFKAYKGHIIFEGAQGLGLDQDHGSFPHVTRSNTGLLNVVGLCNDMGVDVLKAIYVTRPYITRHGAGPLDNELAGPPWFATDETNIPNRWQGMLRFAWIDLTHMCLRIRRDLEIGRDANSLLKIEPTVMLTCVDQIPGSLEHGKIPYTTIHEHHHGSVGDFLREVRVGIKASPNDPCYVSLGPTRATVLPLESSNAKRVDVSSESA